MRCWLALSLLLAVALVVGVPGAGRAAEPRGPRLHQRWGSYWARGRHRPFVAAMVDVGIFYLRPRFSAGFGRPHHAWIGIDANPIVSAEAIGGYAGMRAALPFVDLRVGARLQHSFRRSFLAPAHAFNRLGIENRAGPHARYLSWEAELTTSVPIGPGVLFSEVAGTVVRGVDEGYFVYEETIRVVVDPPLVGRLRLGYLYGFGATRRLRVGLVTELVAVPRRELLVLRAGALVRLRLFRNLELRGNFVPAVASRDELGLAGGDSFQIGVRWRWASGSRSFD